MFFTNFVSGSISLVPINTINICGDFEDCVIRVRQFFEGPPERPEAVIIQVEMRGDAEEVQQHIEQAWVRANGRKIDIDEMKYLVYIQLTQGKLKTTFADIL